MCVTVRLRGIFNDMTIINKNEIKEKIISNFNKIGKHKRILVIVLLAVIGSLAILISKAATFSIAIEAEQGANNNLVITDQTASGGKAVQFGKATPTLSWWKPPQNTKWQWVLNGVVDNSTSELARFDMYDIDMQDAVPADTTQEVVWPNGYRKTITWKKGKQNPGKIAQLKATGKKVICYMDTGAFEDYRPDASLFPGKWGKSNDRKASVDGGGQDIWGTGQIPYEGPPQYNNMDVVGGDSSDSSGQSFSGEYWLDQRESAWRDIWGPIIWARLDLAKKLGCDGVEGDQNNAYGNDTTFGAIEAISLRLYREVYYQTHLRGLTVISKNGLELTSQQITEPGASAISYCTPGLCVPDGILNEECAQYNECGSLDTATTKGMWVGQVEYKGTIASVCNGAGGAIAKKRMAMKKPQTDPVDSRISFACWEQ